MENRREAEVSILVPVYNVGKYLRECLESIEAQTFKDWECVIVDDGSTDNSGAVCDEFAAHDSRFRVLHMKNGGLASARNNAIKHAKGKFITFCDSDDWYAPETIETMYGLITEYDADIVQTGLWKEYDGHTRVKPLTDRRLILDRQAALMELVKNKMVPSYVWNKMWRRELIGPDFPMGKTFEDIHVCTLWFPKITKMVIDPTPLYHYRMRKGSILHVGSSKYRLDFYNAMRFRAQEILKLGLDSFTQNDHDAQVAKAAVSAGKIIARQEKDENKRTEIIEDLSKSIRQFQLPKCGKLGLKQWFRANLLRSKPKIFIRLMRILGKSDLHSKYRTRNLFP